ncbi:hypothetical protein K469DRAFT_307671 [Zopfia rhizophila CBS 207.26]|uniref:Uncharacterized protein n=1 Tax=Zopfia rhizophila CBS 207.26 TaxID=1314779 RepID=A0A6A6ENF0_9PEZI|nr:hypothetical protein K469DRAFT_307671 [Zopfia rhizophila CBS 207.26]
MSSRYAQAGPSWPPPEPAEPDLYMNEDDLVSQNANDARLLQAIDYLTSERIDSAEEYGRKVGLINEYIIKQYPEEGYPYDRKLYQQLHNMVRRYQRQVEEREHVIEISSETSEGEDIGELYRVQNDHVLIPSATLARDHLKTAFETYLANHHTEPLLNIVRSITASYPGETTDERLKLIPNYNKLDQKTKTVIRVARDTSKNVLDTINPTRAPVTGGPSAPPSKSAIVLKKQWLYGGPNNEVEEWHKDFPPSFPFGETLHMQRWESEMINHDLEQSAVKRAEAEKKRKAVSKKGKTVEDNPEDLIVKTNVSYPEPRRKPWYESGSRFTLPEVDDEYRTLFEKEAVPRFDLQKNVDDFDRYDEYDLTEKGYTPRVFLNTYIPPMPWMAKGKRPVSQAAPAASTRPRSLHATSDTFSETYAAGGSKQYLHRDNRPSGGRGRRAGSAAGPSGSGTVSDMRLRTGFSTTTRASGQGASTSSQKTGTIDPALKARLGRTIRPAVSKPSTSMKTGIINPDFKPPRYTVSKPTKSKTGTIDPDYKPPRYTVFKPTKSKTGTIDPDYKARIKQSRSAVPRRTTRRAVAVVPDISRGSVAKSAASPSKSTTTFSAKTIAPVKKRPGRPKATPTPVTASEPSKLSLSIPKSCTKRNLDEADDSYEEAMKNKKTKKTPKKKVAFAVKDEYEDDETVVAPVPATAPRKKAKARAPISASTMMRGTTRSGLKFK